MRRPRIQSVTLFALSALTMAWLAACGGGASEEPLVRQFFRASQLRDNQTLANFAVTSVDPRTEGVVQSFDIVSVSEERRQPLTLRELARAHEEARAAETEFTKRKLAFQDANMEAIDRVLKAERSNARVSGKDAEVQAAWTKWRSETADYSKRVSEARTKLQAQRPIAELSVDNPRAPVDVTKLDGELISKDITVNTQVKEPADKGGQVVPKTLVLTFQRATGKVDGKDVTGKWIITSIKSQGAAGTKTS
jgi:hypothetical protein